ncbi:MAG: UTRA domain-containing protein [Dehalococcoidia bacterium]
MIDHLVREGLFHRAMVAGGRRSACRPRDLRRTNGTGSLPNPRSTGHTRRAPRSGPAPVAPAAVAEALGVGATDEVFVVTFLRCDENRPLAVETVYVPLERAPASGPPTWTRARLRNGRAPHRAAYHGSGGDAARGGSRR